MYLKKIVTALFAIFTNNGLLQINGSNKDNNRPV